MIVKKHICDICGKEINHCVSDNTWKPFMRVRIIAKWNDLLKDAYGLNPWKKIDMCNFCAERMIEWIKAEREE